MSRPCRDRLLGVVVSIVGSAFPDWDFFSVGKLGTQRQYSTTQRVRGEGTAPSKAQSTGCSQAYTKTSRAQPAHTHIHTHTPTPDKNQQQQQQTHLSVSSDVLGEPLLAAAEPRGVFLRPLGGRSAPLGPLDPSGDRNPEDDGSVGTDAEAPSARPPTPAPAAAAAAVGVDAALPPALPTTLGLTKLERGEGSLCVWALRRMALFHRFFTAFSDRPGRNFAMSHQRLPGECVRACVWGGGGVACTAHP
jgi:hypothetical protein